MSRLARRTFDALALLSAFLCLAAAALWLRSYFSFDLLSYQPGVALSPREYGLATLRGGILLYDERPRQSTGWQIDHSPARHIQNWPAEVLWFDAGAFQLLRAVDAAPPPLTGPVTHHALYADGWLATLTLAVLPAIRVRRWRRRRRAARDAMRGLCPACRYDLTGNVSGVCPECGTAVRPS